MIRFREFLAGNYPFEMNDHCQKCTVAFWNDLSFWKKTRPDTTSFFYDKRNDCHFESKQRASNPFLSKRASSSYRRESHQSFGESIINHLEVIDHPSFQRENHRHFEKTVNPLFRRESHRHFEKIGNHHIERTGGNHFKTIVLPVINHPLI